MKTIFAFFVMTFLSLTSFAGARRDQTREHLQQTRIRQGVASGELTRHEAKKLRQGQRHVDRMQRRMMRDGKLTPEEAAKLEHAQDVQNKRIYHEKHDSQTRGENRADPATPAVPADGGKPAEPAVPAQPAEPQPH